MDSPKSCKPTTTSTIAAETVPAQESPVFSYISNLSPIQPVKPPPVTQGFPGLNSPPLVFTSPRLNPQSQQTFLKRAQLQGLLAAKIPGGDEGCKNSVSAVNASENLDVQQNTSRITCNEKDSYSHNSVDDQTESPTGCPDQFLTDIVDMDSVDQNVPSDSTSKKSEIIDQPPDAVTVTREIEDVHKEDASTDVSALETDSKKGDAIPVNQCPKIETELPVDHALTNRNQNSMTEEEEAEQAGFLHPSSHSLSGSQQTEKENENSVEGLDATGAVSTEPALKKVRNDLEAFQLRGVRRRCLQFEDALQCNRPAQNPSDSGGPKSLSMETPPTPIEGKQADTIPLYPRNINSTIKIPKPSGIGLHLNSIVNGVQAGSGAVVHVKSAQRGNFSIRGKRSVPIINSHLSDASNSSSVFSLAENVSPSTDDSRPESYASMAVTSTTSLSTFTVKPSNDSVDLNPVEYQSTPGNNKRKYNNTETIGGSGEFKLSPKKKRKKSSDSGDGNGCKRCNCKKSQCLKLYCDCFAAGIYCAEPCACQGCYNRPEYEETVVEARQQIESRNPLAFAPKVVQNNVEPPASIYGEDGTHFTPSSARHKRGCNCKKSMCLKKYCECYQANVGCSDGCRCEGCKNVYGRKGEYGMVKDVLSKDGTNERADGSFVERMVASGNDLYRTELCNPHNLTPLTPAVQFLNHRKDASAAWFHSGEYFQSPESNLSSVAPHMMSPGSPRNPVTNGMISETAPEILDLVDRELCYGNAETADELMRVSHQPGKAGNHSGIPNPQEWANNSKDQSFCGNKQYSSSSLNWPGSPNTPMAQFSGTKHLKVAELDGDLSNIMEDDTPDILKDNPNPLNAVKVSSPNKKRVSPPHSRHHDVSSSSSYGVRTGRKFILKAVPSFPPLTPCIDSKSATQQINDPQNHTHNK